MKNLVLVALAFLGFSASAVAQSQFSCAVPYLEASSKFSVVNSGDDQNINVNLTNSASFDVMLTAKTFRTFEAPFSRNGYLILTSAMPVTGYSVTSSSLTIPCSD